MRRILCIHLNDWPIQRLLVARPELDAARPLILHARDPRRGQRVAACNAAARACGVQVEMPLAEAATLAGEATILPADPSADRAALARLAEHCERYSPLVGWETVDQARPLAGKAQADTPDALFLDVTGIGVLFGGEDRLIQAAISDLARLGYQARAAIDSTIGAAWAWCVGACSSTSKQSEEKNLAALPLAALRIPSETVELLAQLGVTQVQQLISLPRPSLKARFGERLLLRLDQFLGGAPETIVPHRPPPRFAVQQVLEYPTSSRELIERLIWELVEHLALALAERREGAMRLACRLDCEEARPVVLQAGLCHPSANASHLWEVLRIQLEQLALPAPAGRISLAAPLTAPLQNRQQELFGGSQRQAAMQLELLVDRLASRLGTGAVLRPKLTADPVPERAVICVPASDPPARRRTKAVLPRPSQRPLLLHHPPRPLEVLSVVPDGPPISFHLGGQAVRIRRWSGPERIESGWWRGASARRDYYRVEIEAGLRYWIFRRLQDGAWFLHGEFS